MSANDTHPPRAAAFFIDRDRGVVVDSSVLQMLGYPETALEGENPLLWLRERIHPSDLEAVLNEQLEVLDGTRDHARIELRLRGASGGYRWFLRTAVRTDRGIVGLLEPVDELRARQHRHGSLVANLPLGLASYRLREDGELVLVGANRAATSILGLDLENRHGETLEQLFPGISQTDYPKRFREIAVDGGSFEEVRSIYDGEVVSGVFDVVTFQSAPGEVTIVFTDVTDREQLQVRAEKSEARFRTLFERAPVMINSFDERGDVLLWNRECEHRLGYSIEDIRRASDKIGLFEPEGETRESVLEAFAAGDGEFREYRIKTKAGDERIQRWANISLGSEFIGVGYDVTELSQTVDDLEQFAHLASHDLKTPLDGIRNLATWLREDNAAILSERSLGHLAAMELRIGRMEQMLGDLLDYARAGRQATAPEEIDCEALVAGVIDQLGVPSAFAIKTTNLGTARTFRVPLEIVMRNLIDNAIKHHDRPTGTVEISSVGEGDFIRFAVTDDGPGIPTRYHRRVFEVFETLKTRDEVEGTGMGLAIVRKTTEQLGGRVALVSEGRGTRIELTWPSES